MFYEQFRIYDVMDFNYKTIPSCQNPSNLTVALSGGAPCVGNDAPAPGSTTNQPGIKGDGAEIPDRLLVVAPSLLVGEGNTNSASNSFG